MAALHTEYLSEDLDDAGNHRPFALHCPPGFNFGYDVLDRLGALSPARRTMPWSTEAGATRALTCGEISRHTHPAAHNCLALALLQ